MTNQTEQAQHETFETLPPIKYDVNLATISELREKYMPLVITDLNDKEQFDTIHEARMVMVKIRTTIEKSRKSQKAGALQYGKDVDAAAKILFDEGGPIESHLQAEENKVLQERERVKAEEERLERKKIQSRVDALLAFNVILPFVDVAIMTDKEYLDRLYEAKTQYQTEQKRLEDEKEAREAEEARLASERAELDRIREEQEKKDKDQEEKEKALEAERKALEDAKQEEIDRKKREEEKERARIQAEKDAEEKIKREAQEKKDREEAEEKEKARQEELRPDMEKLFAFGGRIHVLAAEEISVKSEDALNIYNQGIDALTAVAHDIIRQAGEM